MSVQSKNKIVDQSSSHTSVGAFITRAYKFSHLIVIETVEWTSISIFCPSILEILLNGMGAESVSNDPHGILSPSRISVYNYKIKCELNLSQVDISLCDGRVDCSMDKNITVLRLAVQL